MRVFDLTWQLLVIFLLVLANGFFVAAEFAIVKVRVTQLKPMQKKGDWRAALAISVIRHLDAYLSATQLGITLSSLGLGWLGEPFLAHWIEPTLASIGLTSRQAIESISFGIAFSFITFLHIVLGELAPKSLAIQRPRRITLWIAPILIVFYQIFRPFIWVLNSAANLMLRSVGIPPAGEMDHVYSPEELQYVLMHSSHVHPSDELINKLMLKALRLKETTAEQTMIPREKVSVLWRDKPLSENLALAQRAGYSRMPLCGGSLDEVLGVIHIKELLWQYAALGAQTSLTGLVRPVLTFVPKTKLPSMLELFRKSRNHLAVVVDASDRMTGIVSFEDVLEELVGDIRDEFDIEKGPIFERTDTTALVDTDMPIRDLAIETGWPLPTQSSDSVSQWAAHFWGHAPKTGESLEVDGFTLIAEDVGARGMRRLRLIRHPSPNPSEADHL